MVFLTTIKMSAIPQGAFAAVKIKQNFDKEDKGRGRCRKDFYPNKITLQQPLFNYSSKLMNSIWGLYNQYSVHNLKKNTDAGDFNVF